MSHIGGRSTGSQRAARMKRSRAVKTGLASGNLGSATFIGKFNVQKHNNC